jgi:hypothetical protein
MTKKPTKPQTAPETAPEAAPEQAALMGYIDFADWQVIRGWAYDPATPNESLWLEVQVDDGPAAPFLANLRRQDLIDAGYGDGSFGFDLRFPHKLDPLVPHAIMVRRRSDKMPMLYMPLELPRAPMSSTEVRAAFEAAISAEIAAVQEGPELDATMGFLLQQVDRLMQGRVDSLSGITALQQFRLRWNDYLEGERAVPLQPDARPWALVVDTELPETAPALAAVAGLQALGYRVAAIGTRALASEGAVVKSLTAMDVTVYGEPHYYTVEDVLRRHRGQFRAVLLRGATVAAGYGVVARIHQPRGRIVAFLNDPATDRSDPVLNLGAALVADTVVVETEAARTALKAQLPGRKVEVVSPDDSVAVVTDSLTRMITPATHAATPAG